MPTHEEPPVLPGGSFLYTIEGSKIQTHSSGGGLLTDGLDGSETCIFHEGTNANKSSHLLRFKTGNCEK